MLKLMLESVDVILGRAIEAKTMRARTTYINCASDTLKKCIEAIKEGSIEEDVDTPKLDYHPLHPRKVPVHKTPQEYEIRVDGNVLAKLVDKDGKEAPPEFLLEIDGVQVMYEDAKGKPFTTGKFL